MRGLRPQIALMLLAAAALPACTTSDILEPSAIVPQTSSLAPLSSGAQAAQPGQAPIESARAESPATGAISSSERLQFAPIVGTPVEAAAPLSARLADRARQRGIGLARAGEPTNHILKGYFSAIGEGGQTTVIYVWDVLDPAGNRMHRIQGQQKVAGGDGWSSVNAAAMQAIADSTIDSLASWLASRSG